MPNILTIPREIRDEIYTYNLHSPLPSSLSRTHYRTRSRIAYSASDPSTHYGEDAVRYPVHTSPPAAHALLHTCRQVRAEILERVRSLGPVKYRIEITDRDDRGTLYPMWVSVPVGLGVLVGGRVDVVECGLRIRNGKSGSVWSVDGEGEGDDGEGPDWKGDMFFGGLGMLQRFVERGVYFLSRKKGGRVTVGELVVDVDKKSEWMTEQDCVREVDEFADRLDEWMKGVYEFGTTGEEQEREDRQFRFLAGRIDRLCIKAKGNVRREWDLRETVLKRDEEARLRAAQVDVQQ